MVLTMNTKTGIALFSIFALLLVGTIAYHDLERWSWGTSFYFSVTTLTTVGYGDVTPTSETSRLFTAFYILIGVAIVLASLGVIGTNYLTGREERLLRLQKEREKRHRRV